MRTYLGSLVKEQCAWLKKFKILIALVLFYGVTVNHIEFHKIGIARNLFTGNMWLQRAGWNVSWPWVIVSEIDTRPMRVSVQSSGRGFDSKLVRFVPEHWKEFVDTEGFRYYWWSNRISFNLGYSEEYRGMKDIMRGYAYSTKKYPFIEILSGY